MSDHSTRISNPNYPEVGDRFGRLVVIGERFHHRNASQYETFAPVRCDCGVEKAVRVSCLKKGVTRSCGCLRVEVTKARNARNRVKPPGPTPFALPEPGTEYDRWRVLWIVPDPSKEFAPSQRMARCVCDCGTERDVSVHSLNRGVSRSCGCISSDLNRSRRKHDGKGTRLYQTWKGIKQRTSNPNCRAANNYLLRGIRVCQEWASSFELFRVWSLTNGYLDDLFLERIDNDKGYSPSNCAWVTRKAQARNTRSNVWLTAWGERRVMAEWAEDPRCKVRYRTLSMRVRYGWDHEKAISTPWGAKGGGPE